MRLAAGHAVVSCTVHTGRVQRTTIPIQPAETAATPGCGDCLHSAAGPVCRADLAPSTGPAVLEGPSELLAAVMSALDRDLGLRDAGDLSATGLVQGLSIRDGEAVLKLAVAPRCGGARLADTAFQTLRRLLPDTDIYVEPLG